MVTSNQIFRYSKRATIIIFLIIAIGLTLYLTRLDHKDEFYSQTKETSTVPNEKFQKDNLFGVWIHTYPESDLPFDSDDMEFSIDNGLASYVSHVHNEPVYTGGYSWNLDNNLVTIFSPEEGVVDQFRIVSLDVNGLIIQRASSSPIIYERFRN